MSEQEKKQAGKGLLVIGIVAIVVVAVLVGVIIFLLVKQRTPEEDKRQVLVTEDNVEEVVKELEEQDDAVKNAPGSYTVTMWTTWHFKDGSEASYDGYVINVEENTNDVYFDIVMADNEDDVIYRSPIIPIGGRLDEIILDRDLDAGTYETVCIYNLVDENQNSLSQVRIYLTLVIEG